MNSAEKKAVACLAGIFALRMFGLFLLLPVLAVYAAAFPHATSFTIGIAVGVYGLTQGALQIPFGVASDRFGRKRIITIGLCVFAAGSIIAALADSMTALIIGRAIQGGGAVSAAVLALTADRTRDAVRTTAMAVIGVSIGGVFLLSLMLAPPLAGVIGVTGIFWLCAALAMLAIAILWFGLADAPATKPSSNSSSKSTITFRQILADRQLLSLNLGVFFLHLILTALFVTLPALLLTKTNLPLASHWKFYAPVLILSVAGMIPILMYAAKNSRAAFVIAITILCVSTVALAFTASADILPTLIALCIFFVAFNALEAMLPSLVSTVAPSAAKGAAIGVYNTCQFIGMFVGGALAGAVGGGENAGVVFGLCAVLAGVWLAFAVINPPTADDKNG